MEKILKIIFCHLVGDFVFQSAFLAETKGDNMYHLVCHCFLYILPFYLAFGYNPLKLSIMLLSHFVVDLIKSRYHKINNTIDQLAHILTMSFVYLVL